ncbi:response regulator [Muricoccus radiodurans]|uniref:response regulator n=1 Tax=Muricoccus radiodurans TaxID=2231721 RepID=UPI003CF3831D
MSHATGRLVSRCILLVEDEYFIADEMEQWLRKAGAEVLGPVPSVEQALEIINDDEATGLDGAVLDVNLGPGETVYPVAHRLTALGVPYLFATGEVRVSSDPAHRDRPRVEKPVFGPELLRAVQRLLGTRTAAAG